MEFDYIRKKEKRAPKILVNYHHALVNLFLSNKSRVTEENGFNNITCKLQVPECNGIHLWTFLLI